MYRYLDIPGWFNMHDQCMDELPQGVSPRENARLEIGWTVHGFQAWCVRHDSNVLNVDFEGHKHPAITTRIKKGN